jgi:hypothetical protein
MLLRKDHSTTYKIWSLLTVSERRGAVLLMGLMFVGMVLETLGVGMVVPALGLLTHADVVRDSSTIKLISI